MAARGEVYPQAPIAAPRLGLSTVWEGPVKGEKDRPDARGRASGRFPSATSGAVGWQGSVGSAATAALGALHAADRFMLPAEDTRQIGLVAVATAAHSVDTIAEFGHEGLLSPRERRLAAVRRFRL